MGGRAAAAMDSRIGRRRRSYGSEARQASRLMAELLDNSVWARRHHRLLRDWFGNAIAARQLFACDMLKFEALYSARNAHEFIAWRDQLEDLPWCRIGPAEFARALDV